MGFIARIAKVIEVFQAIDNVAQQSLQSDMSQDENTTSVVGQPAGYDAQPLPGDRVVLVPIPGSNKFVAIAFNDSVNEKFAQPGEVRIYSRDADGTTKAAIHLKADDSIEMHNEASDIIQAANGGILMVNDSGAINLEAGGTINLNGATIDPGGNISTSGAIDGAGISDNLTGVTLSGHIHSMSVHLHPVPALGTSGPPAPPDTLSPTPGT